MVATFSVTKSRIYANEPSIWIVTGLSDRAGLSDWFNFKRQRYVDEQSPGNLPVGWDEISDSPIYSYDPSEIDPTLPTDWNMDQVRAAFTANEVWKQLSWNPATGTAVIYRGPHGTGYPKYLYELNTRATGITDSQNIDVIRSDMPAYLLATYTNALLQGDLNLNSANVYNVKSTTASIDLKIGNYSAHSGTAFVRVEVRDPQGVTVFYFEDTAAQFNAQPFEYRKQVSVSNLLSSTTYTVHVFVWSSTNMATPILAKSPAKTFSSAAAPVTQQPIIALEYGDLRLNNFSIYNTKATSTGIEVEIRNSSTTHSGSAVIRVEIRDPSGAAIQTVEDTAAEWKVAPSVYKKSWDVVGNLSVNTTYTAHLFVFAGTQPLLESVNRTFKTLSGTQPPPPGPAPLPGISAGLAVAAAGLAYVMFTKSGKNILRKVRL